MITSQTVKRGGAFLERRLSRTTIDDHSDELNPEHVINRLVAALNYAINLGQKNELYDRLKEIERQAADKCKQLSRFYSVEGRVVSLIGNVPYEAKKLREEITSLLFEEDKVRAELKQRKDDYGLADYVAESIVYELARLPRSRKAENVYRRIGWPKKNQRLDECVSAIREAVPDGRWIYFPTEKLNHKSDTYFVQLARISAATGKPILEIAMIYHGNSEDVVLTKVTPEGEADVDFKEFDDGGHAVSYLMKKVVSDI
ncbi:hypothetical protein KY343_04555 [Candidatus Woesearchaeota archaeon]|nr:hypothetical protein [Candidatus Woesearchaeota archaeon]